MDTYNSGNIRLRTILSENNMILIFPDDKRVELTNLGKCCRCAFLRQKKNRVSASFVRRKMWTLYYIIKVRHTTYFCTFFIKCRRRLLFRRTNSAQNASSAPKSIVFKYNVFTSLFSPLRNIKGFAERNIRRGECFFDSKLQNELWKLRVESFDRFVHFSKF